MHLTPRTAVTLYGPLRAPKTGAASGCLTRRTIMTNAVVLSRTDRDHGYIETLQPERGEIYYRSCVGGVCRYSSDLWQAEMYLDQMLNP